MVDPPVAVVVDLGQAIPTRSLHFGANKLPMRVRAGGLDLSGSVPGLLHAWARATDGGWLGLITFTVTTGNRHGSLEVRQWCVQQAITPRDPGS
ncbi:hypothetical protein [Nocardia sp. NPDC050175]|uniref:hypothetical protein n=1 Tax=Nocardia sp. NPDC050175 TaxID=3364317 RepID=UPI0037B484F7